MNYVYDVMLEIRQQYSMGPMIHLQILKARPRSIKDFLEHIDFPQYINILMSNGWDDIEFIHIISDEDLVEIGISNPDHRWKVSRAVLHNNIYLIRYRTTSNSVWILTQYGFLEQFFEFSFALHSSVQTTKNCS